MSALCRTMTLSHEPVPRRALIVIDPHTFNTDDSAIVGNINRLLAEQWDYVVLTSDRSEPWHPALGQCAVSAEEVAHFQEEDAAAAWAARDPDEACGGGPVTAEMLARMAKEFRIYKGRRHDGISMPCFSAFDGVGACDVTLEMALKGRCITDVTICGLCHEIGIQTTAQDAAKLGFHTTVVREACRFYVGMVAPLTGKGVRLL